MPNFLFGVAVTYLSAGLLYAVAVFPQLAKGFWHRTMAVTFFLALWPLAVLDDNNRL